ALLGQRLLPRDLGALGRGLTFLLGFDGGELGLLPARLTATLGDDLVLDARHFQAAQLTQ
ncbi:MAG TPA: hypothetical protein VIA18_10895, partial [Polyangia bacterium]|nr:hypothetical protein [Polyangia bacterium]